MNRWHSLLRIARYLLVSVFVWLCFHAERLAFGGEEVSKQGVKGSKWVMSYGLVILGLGLGLLVVLHASKRRDRAKPEVYEGEK